ncbi:MAG: response regulator [Oligoflexia bacterium]|nr:response regulator [Oligoflexia bacterium]
MSATVLLIDDDPVIRELHEMWLKDHGYDVIPADNGAQGLALIRQGGALALILLDLQMPRMNGIEFLRVLFEEVAPTLPGPLPPVVVLSSASQLAKDFPQVAALLEKPCSPRRLLETIRKLTSA